jgi:hypothetical protein
VKQFATLALALLALPSFAEQAKPADSFVDSIGVNTHLSYTNTSYFSQFSDVLTALRVSRIRHIRDGITENATVIAHHQALHALGIDCDYVAGPKTTQAQILAMQKAGGDMAFLEDLNEIDDQRLASWTTTLDGSMNVVNQAAALAHVPVIGPSFTKAQSFTAALTVGPRITYNNLHVYMGGRYPGDPGWGSGDAEGHHYGSIAWWLDQAHVDAPTAPVIVTETGYYDLPVPAPYQITPEVSARYVTRAALEMFNAGIAKSYIYELLDDQAQPGYGLIDASLKPKPALRSLTALLEILSDPGPKFTPASLDYALTDADGAVHHTLLQKRDGTFYLALWEEVESYDETKNVYVPVKHQSVHIALKSAHAEQIIRWFDSGSISGQSISGATEFDVPLTDRLTLIEIKPIQ